MYYMSRLIEFNKYKLSILYVRIYIYVCVCVCVTVCNAANSLIR